jgi:thiamine biosynthesis protein ThiI
VTGTAVGAPREAVVRFNEIALKGKNRPRFIAQLMDNIRRATAGLGVEEVWSERLLVRLRLADGAPWEPISQRLGRVFGAVKLSLARPVPLDYEAIEAAVLEEARARSFATFRVTANRADKRFPLTSYEMNVRLGDAVREATGAPVSLSGAEADLHVDVMGRGALVYTGSQEGAGGLPVGTAGRVGVLMSGGIDSPVAVWRMLRRGCRAELIHFHSFPLVEGRSREKAQELAGLLNAWQYDTRLHLVPFAVVQREAILAVPGPLRVVVYRRFMVRIAEAIARAEGARALVTGESVGQVGSQTLTNIATVDAVAQMPILRPLIGMDKQEIIEQARAIGTFETSILPDEDCCTLFVPRSPSTAVTLEQAARAEEGLDAEGLVAQAVRETETFEYHMPG